MTLRRRYYCESKPAGGQHGAQAGRAARGSPRAQGAGATLADMPMAVALAGGQLLGPLSIATALRTDAHRVEQWLGVQRLPSLVGAEMHGQQHPCAVSEQVELGAPAVAALPERVVLRLVPR